MGGGAFKPRDPTKIIDLLEKIEKFFKYFSSKEAKELARKDEKSFQRNRKMDIADHINLLLTKKGLTLKMELRNISKKTEKEEITKQGYSKSRDKINPEFLVYLNDKYVSEAYKTRKIILYRNKYLILGVDGSTNELPNDNNLKKHYGVSQGRENSVGRVRARVAGVYDCCNEIMIAAKIGPYNKSEKELAEELIMRMNEIIPEEKTIMIFDRYYFGVAFAHKLEKIGQKYVMRLRKDHYKEEKKKIKKDGQVEIEIRTNSVFYAEDEIKEELKKMGKISVRMIKVDLGEEEEYLVTNLTEEEMPYEDAKEIYYQRWGIEKSFDIIKNKIEIENYSSRKVNGIEQEFNAGILVNNIIEELSKEAEKEKTIKSENEYKVNKNILVGIYKEEILKVISIENKKEQRKAYMQMIKEMSENVVEIKEGRTFARRKMHSMNKYRHNNRRNA